MFLLVINTWTLKLKIQYYLQLIKTIKYLGINLPKHRQDSHAKNYSMLTREIEVDLNGEIYHVHGLVNLR